MGGHAVSLAHHLQLTLLPVRCFLFAGDLALAFVFVFFACDFRGALLALAFGFFVGVFRFGAAFFFCFFVFASNADNAISSSLPKTSHPALVTVHSQAWYCVVCCSHHHSPRAIRIDFRLLWSRLFLLQQLSDRNVIVAALTPPAHMPLLSAFCCDDANSYSYLEESDIL